MRAPSPCRPAPALLRCPRRRLQVVEAADVDELVLDAEDQALAGLDVPPAHEAHRIRGGRLVEGPSQRGPPVQDHLAVLSVLQPGASHVVPPTGVGDRSARGPALRRDRPRAQVHPAEHEPVLDPLQGGDQARVVHSIGVPLPAGLVGAGRAAGLRGRQGPPRLGQLAVELGVGQIDDHLLGGDLALARGLGGGGGGARAVGLSHMTSLEAVGGCGCARGRRAVGRTVIRRALHYSPDRSCSTTVDDGDLQDVTRSPCRMWRRPPEPREQAVGTRRCTR